MAERARTLSIDIGGTGIKMMVLDVEAKPLTERTRELTPHPASPDAVHEVISIQLAKHGAFDRVSVGFPGVVQRGVVKTAPNLGTPMWAGQRLESALSSLTGKPTRVINDADLLGFGVIRGQGVEMVLTLGTGLGCGLYVDGQLMPNLELGHHPFRKGKTYEDLVSDAQLKRVGKKRWSRRVHAMLGQLAPIFNYDLVYVGGGNARKIKGELPANAKRFENVEGMRGGIRLWAR
jgi:polyphosphate glucokinase